jgi:2-polyprenyl-6-methoxyphenol hydroxylase-like FAD-dependent oxidoreductase
VHFGASFVGLLTDHGRVAGARIRMSDGAVEEVAATILIGADGRHSAVARAVAAGVVHQTPRQSGVVYGYWPAPATEESFWYWGHGTAAGAIPTNDGEWCVFASLSHERFGSVFAADVRAGYHRVIADCAPGLDETLRATGASPPLRGFAGQPGVMRQAVGAGWALVGDAGYFKDPITAHGITDALRDAELLSTAILAGSDVALARYQETRDDLSRPLFEITDRVASYEWTIDELKDLHRRLSDEMKREVAAMTAAPAPNRRTA